jgi:hypothetical protein
MPVLLAIALAASNQVSAAPPAPNPCVRAPLRPAGDPANNAEMVAIYGADQADRENTAKIDFSVVRPRDEARRSRTSVLLAGGQLKTGDDYYYAAFVYQHGDGPDDILIAHTLAMAAAARARPGAAWIAAASLDRYLQRIGKPQIYGTQFLKRDKKWTQEPYNRDFMSDALRQASCVPSLAEQKEQLKETQREMP